MMTLHIMINRRLRMTFAYSMANVAETARDLLDALPFLRQYGRVDVYATGPDGVPHIIMEARQP